MFRRLEIAGAFRPSLAKATAVVCVLAGMAVWKEATRPASAPGSARSYAAASPTLPSAAPIAAVARLAPPVSVVPAPQPPPEPPRKKPVAKVVKKAAAIAAATAAVKKAVADNPPIESQILTPMPASPAGGDDEDDDDADWEEELVVDRLLDEPAAEPQLAIETFKAEDELVRQGFDEASPEGDYHAVAAQSAAQLDLAFELDHRMPREPRLVLQEGTIRPNDFASIRERLLAARTAVVELGEPLKAPGERATAKPVAEAAKFEKKNDPDEGPVLVNPAVAPAPRVVSTEPKAEPELVRPSAKPKAQRPRAVARVAPPAPAPAIAAPKPRTLALEPVRPKLEARTLEETGPSRAPVLVRPETPLEPESPKAIAAAMATEAPKASAILGPAIASVATLPVLTTPPALTTQPPSGLPKPRVMQQQSAGPMLVTPRSDNAPEAEGGVIFGHIYTDRAMDQWLEAKKGHIELYLHPVKSLDPQDTIFADYQYPADSFQIDGHRLRGSYRLIAGVFEPSGTQAVAQVAYGDPITAATYKRRIQFKVTRAAFDVARKTDHVRSGTLLLTTTLFEGATGDYRKPTPIKGGQVRVLGLESLGAFTSDAEGNVRIPGVPGRSELALVVDAPGFYRAQPVVPTSQTNVYRPVYLISRDKVDAITRFFTKSVQQDRGGLVMGRVFDPTSRAPLADQKVALSFRKGHALYFDSLPDTRLDATTGTGLFGFFNVAPSFRSLSREGKPSLVVNVRPGTAEYIELGRGGKAALKGKLFDPFQNEPRVAKVRLVGSPHSEIFTELDGTFQFPDLDFPPGVLTLEVESQGYPLTWHSIAWNAHERESERQLFLMEYDLITESAARVAKTKLRGDRGSLVGGAEAGFFRPKYGCVQVSLQRTDGDKVDPAAGPFPLMGDRPETDKPLCLTARKPGFTWFNVPAGEYLLKWSAQNGQVLRTRVLNVGLDRVTVVVN